MTGGGGAPGANGGATTGAAGACDALSARLQTVLDEAHDRVNKDQALKARYAEARLEAGR